MWAFPVFLFFCYFKINIKIIILFCIYCFLILKKYFLFVVWQIFVLVCEKCFAFSFFFSFLLWFLFVNFTFLKLFSFFLALCILFFCFVCFFFFLCSVRVCCRFFLAFFVVSFFVLFFILYF